jgi:glutamate--cysteine ligase
MSMPCKLPEHDAIPIAHYGDSPEAKEKEVYRRGLALRYGKYMQMISGVHYNTSFTQEFWEIFMKAVGDTSEKQHFINEGYLHLVRNFIRYRWLLAYLFGASPLNHDSYRCTSLHKDRNEAVSLRLSRCGYSNPANIHITYNNFQEHFNDIKKAVETPHPAYTKLGLEKDGQRIQLNDHILQIGNEYYFSIRLKPPKPYDDVLDALAKHGVEYIEVRIFDLNPFDGIGVNADQLYFCRLFLLFCLFEPSPPVDEKMLNVSTQNQQIVALKGRNPSLKIEKDGEMIGLTEWSKELLEAMQPLAELLDQNFKKPLYTRILTHYMQALKDPSLLPGFKVMNEMKEKKEDFLEYGLEKARKYHELFSKKDA